MTDEKKNNPRSQPNATSFSNPAQIREQAEQRAKTIPLPDLSTMTQEEIQQQFHELHVKQIETELQNEQLCSGSKASRYQAEILTTITENMLDMIGLADIEGNFIFAGKVHEVLGYESGFLIGKNVMDFVHAEDLSYLLQEFSQLLASGVSNPVEYRYRKMDGSYLWFETVGKVICDENGTPHQIVFNTRNITARKRTEEELRESEELNRTILNTVMDGFLVIDSAGRLIEVNETYCKMSGYTERELLGLSIHSIEDVETSAETDAHIQKVMVQGEDRFESLHTRKDGSLFDVEVNVQYWPTYGPQLVVFIRDITARKRAERQIENEVRLRNILLDNVPNCIALILKKQTHEIVASNKAAAAIGAVPGKTCFGICAERGDRCPFCLTPELYATKQVQKLEGEYRGRWYEGVWAPFTDDLYIHYLFDITKRKRSEEALRESEERYRELVENTNSIILRMDMEGRISFFNDYAQFFFGYEAWEIIGRNVVGTIVPERDFSGNDLRTMIADIGQHPERYVLNENENMKKDGRRVWVCWSNKAVLDSDGKVREILCVGNDATARKEAEQLLQISEKRVRAKLDAVLRPEGDIGHLDLVDIIDTTTIQHLMDDFYKLTNISGAIVGLDGNVVASTEWREICSQFHRTHPATLENCIESDTKLSEGIEPGQFREYRCKNNMWDIATPIVVGDKHFGNIFIGQFFYEDEDIDYGSFRAQARKFGFDEAVYMDALDRVPRLSRYAVERVMNYYSRFAELISTLSYSNLKLARTLEEHKCNEQEREKLQSQLNQAQKMESVGRLAGGVAHDFNNKLAIINGYAEVAMEMIDPSNPLFEMIQEIHTAGKQSADIVRQLLAFARQQTISPVLLDLNDTIASMLKMLQRLIGENIDLVWHPGKNLWPVKIDPSQVDQIMANLAVNARDAISDVGTLTIETKNTVVDEEYCKSNPEAIPGRYVMLAVSDDGFGIEKEVRDQLFEPFFTTKAIGKGTGLGLSTIYGIIKQNKGYVNVYSEPGEETSFKIYLPSHEAEKSFFHAAKESSGEVPMGSETILLVEDEPAILKMGTAMIERLGYTLLTAENPNDALRFALEYDGKIDLLITDVIMPKMNGRDLSSRLIQIHPGLNTLYMSGYTADVIAHHGVLDEGVQFIQKPFSLRDLAIKVRAVIEQGVLSTEVPVTVGRG